MSFVLFLAALAAGLSNPFQSGLNAELNRQLAKPLWTTIFVYLSGLAALLLLQAVAREAIPASRIAAVTWWAWLGGLVSIISTIVGLTVAQKLGSGIFTGTSLTASILTSVALDHFGLIGFRQHAASPARLVGCVLMVGGLWLIARF